MSSEVAAREVVFAAPAAEAAVDVLVRAEGLLLADVDADVVDVAAFRAGAGLAEDDDEEANFGADDRPIDANISSSSAGFFFSTFFFGGGALGFERLLM